MPGHKVIYDNGTYAGWIDITTAKKYVESTYWDGHNNISRATGSQWDHEVLYLSRRGIYVLHSWSDRDGSPGRWLVVTPEVAAEWLTTNQYNSDDQRVAAIIQEAEL